jgi:hypothetical protein
VTPAEILMSYRNMIAQVGQPVAIRRSTGTGTAQTFTDTQTMAYVRNYGSKELVGSIAQGDQSAVTLVDGLTAILPLRTTDKLIVNGQPYSIKNPMRRVVGGVLIAYEIHASG